MSIEFQMNGSKEMKDKARKLQESLRQGMLNGVDRWDIETMKLSASRTPVDTGDLLDSRYVEDAHFVGDEVRANMGYTAPHALFVHEDLEAHHPNGQAKFQESAMNDRLDLLQPTIAEEIQKAAK